MLLQSNNDKDFLVSALGLGAVMNYFSETSLPLWVTLLLNQQILFFLSSSPSKAQGKEIRPPLKHMQYLCVCVRLYKKAEVCDADKALAKVAPLNTEKESEQLRRKKGNYKMH